MYKKIIRLMIMCLMIGAINMLVDREANAMRSTNYIKIIAWSEDGKNVLMEKSLSGPEGGGTFGYMLINCDTGFYKNYTLSSDMSPGDGSRPQSISLRDANAVLKDLKKATIKSGFSGLEIEEIKKAGKEQGLLGGKFGFEDRRSAVFITPKHEEKVTNGFFKNDGTKIHLDMMEITKEKDTIFLNNNKNSQIVLMESKDMQLNSIRAYCSPMQNTILFLMETEGWRGNELGPVFYSSTGEVKEFKPVTLKYTK